MTKVPAYAMRRFDTGMILQKSQTRHWLVAVLGEEPTYGGSSYFGAGQFLGEASAGVLAGPQSSHYRRCLVPLATTDQESKEDTHDHAKKEIYRLEGCFFLA